MSNPETLEQLRAVIRNEDAPITARKQAAQLLVSELVDAVQEPGESDADVLALMAPPNADDEMIRELCRQAWAYTNETRGWAASGPTVLQACRHAHERRRTHLLKVVYQDVARHPLEREAGARRYVDTFPPQSLDRRNGVTAERLLAEADRA